MKSIWENDCIIDKRETLESDINVSTLVIGAGMAGILTAYRLALLGEDVAVIDSNRIGGGQTKNTTAKITSQHGVKYSTLERQFGKRIATAYAKTNNRAINDYEDLIGSLGIECDFRRLPSYIYTMTDRQKIIDEYTSAKRCGLNPILTEKLEIPVTPLAGLCFENQAEFSPLKFIAGISDYLTIYENTPALSVDRHNTVTTTKGKINANNIVFACHYPFLNFPGLSFARIHQERSYVIALENTPKLNGVYKCIDNGGISLRSYDKYCLFGGEAHRTGENHRGCYDRLFDKARELYPECKQVMKWSAQDCKTADGIPYIGKFPFTNRNLYMATGFDKWGMTTSMVAARILSHLIKDGKANCSEIYSPSRLHIHSIPTIINESGTAIKNLCMEKFYYPNASIANLHIGDGGIVSYKGEKLGVYRKSENEIYFVSTKCPHLGCQLTWNSDELSWDCPCHGSRFDYEGNVICGPAQQNIAVKIDLD